MRTFLAGICMALLPSAVLSHDTTGDGHGTEVQQAAAHANLIIVQLTDEGPQTIQIAQGSIVTVQFSAPDLGELHLHGYDVLAEPDENGLTSITLTADIAGRFAIVTHAAQDLLGRDEKAVAYIEVLPE